MASWGTPRGRMFRDASPQTPLTPLSPNGLPQWLRPSRSRNGRLFNGRTRVILMGTMCLALGFMVTSVLGPGDGMLVDMDSQVYDVPSGGVLDGLTGFGARPEQKKRPGIIGSDEEEEINEDGLRTAGKKPTVGGALSDLHHAVSDKLQSWNPYFVKSATQKGGDTVNDTTNGAGTKSNNSTFLGGEIVKDGLNEEDRLGARTRIGKATVLFSGNMFWERCIRTHERHDKEHGYRLHILRQQLVDDVWSKPAYILSLLLREMSKHESDRLDWLFWVDADTVILNPKIPIETFLPPPGTEFDDVYLLYSNDWNGLNNGVFPIRVNQWAVRLFAAIVAYRHYNPTDSLVFRDQSAMNALMQKPEFAKHIMQAPQRWFNAYQGEHNETLQPFQVRRGDLLVHFAGVPARETRMHYWLERAEQHLDDWEVPVKSTSYIQEARDFWNEQKGIRQHRNVRLEEAQKQAQTLMSTTDLDLRDCGDRPEEEQRSKIAGQRDELKKIVEQVPTMQDLAKIEEGIKHLREASGPLTAAIAEANKQLLKFAHDTIFTGEKDLLDGGFGQGASSPEMELISLHVQKLKEMVMAPQDKWNRIDIKSAINILVESRAKLQEKVAAEIEAKKQAQAQQAANAELIEKAKAAANAEAIERAKAAAQNGVTQADTVVAEVAAAQDGIAVDPVVVTAPGPTQWIPEVITSTNSVGAAYTAINIEPVGF